jgi:glycosyltransferase involved in cell wall biosynthesis
MKIAYLSVYRDGTGYAHAARDNILALEKMGYDVVCRPVRMEQSPPKQVCVVKHLEQKNLKNVDVVIQHCLPVTYVPLKTIRNIGIFDWETNTICKTWVDSLNQMTEVWVPSIQNQTACLNSGVTVPVKIFPHSCDIEKYNNKPNISKLEAAKDKCVFYFIGENTRRKNIAGLIRGYYAAFTNQENVLLVIKTSVPGFKPERGMQTMRKLILDIKKATHIHNEENKYPPIMVLVERLSDEQLSQLHASCNVFVSTSHGEGGNIPAMDAMGYGNPVILSNWGFHPELCYVQAYRYWEPNKETFIYPGEIDCGWLVKGQLTYCFGQLNGFNDMYTGSEKWFDICLPSFVETLKRAYLEYGNETLKERGLAAEKRIRAFSHENVGIILKGLLND